MSSYDGGTTVTGQSDPALQLAPTGSGGPDFACLKRAFEDVTANSQPYTDQCVSNYRTRYALWTGQSSDGKKHAREGSKTDPTPWEGASDLRVYEVDGAINRKVALYRMAFKKANLVASPVTSNEFKRARTVSNFMRWMIHTQIPDVDREIELLANYILEKGVAASGQFWETKQEKTLVPVSVQQLQQQFPQVDILAILADGERSEQLMAIFEEQYGCSKRKAQKMVKELGATGKTTVATLGRVISRPVFRAFNLDEQLFIPHDTTDIETATGIYRVEYFTPEALRSMVTSDGWDEAWVEKAIEKCRGKLLNTTQSEFQQPVSRSLLYNQQRLTDKIAVVYAYRRLSDEDGVPGIYLTIFNPHLPPEEGVHSGYAKSGLLEYAHGQYPFVLYRREFLSRRLHDSRGLPEPGKSFQDAIKAHRDSRIDAASISIIPPFMFPMGRPPTRVGPGARIPERRPGEYHFGDKLSVDGLTETSEAILTETFKSYCGFMSKDGDPIYAQTLGQNETDRFLSGLAKAFSQVFCLYGQYGEDKVYFRVTSTQDADLTVFEKGPLGESYNFFLTWDVQSMDMEQMAVKWKAIIEGIQLLNREGNVNFAAALQKYIESIDPNIAETILVPVKEGQERIMKEEVEDLTKIFAGFNVPAKPSTPPQLGLQVMQTWMQSPDVQARLAQDKDFRGRVEARAKMYQFASQQDQNRLIGRQGAQMPGPEVPN